jgi:hypothetical protein
MLNYCSSLKILNPASLSFGEGTRVRPLLKNRPDSNPKKLNDKSKPDCGAEQLN